MREARECDCQANNRSAVPVSCAACGLRSSRVSRVSRASRVSRSLGRCPSVSGTMKLSPERAKLNRPFAPKLGGPRNAPMAPRAPGKGVQASRWAESDRKAGPRQRQVYQSIGTVEPHVRETIVLGGWLP